MDSIPVNALQKILGVLFPAFPVEIQPLNGHRENIALNGADHGFLQKTAHKFAIKTQHHLRINGQKFVTHELEDGGLEGEKIEIGAVSPDVHDVVDVHAFSQDFFAEVHQFVDLRKIQI